MDIAYPRQATEATTFVYYQINIINHYYQPFLKYAEMSKSSLNALSIYKKIIALYISLFVYEQCLRIRIYEYLNLIIIREKRVIF